jgi:YD repeat-containing protein
MHNVSAGTPSYVGPYKYHTDSNGFDAREFIDESSLMQWVFDTYKANAQYCNYVLVPPTGQWGTGIYETGPVEGVETMARRGFSVMYNLGSAASCRTDLPPNGAGITSIRRRLVCASTQLYVPNGNKCVTLTPVAQKDSKGANGGKAFPSVADPINPGTGNMWDEQTDLAPTGSSASLSLKRTYSSDRYTTGQTAARAFGARWTHKYDSNLVQTLAVTSYSTTQCWRRSDNNELICPPPPPPTFSPIPEAVNVFTGDGKSYLFNRNGNVWAGDADTNDRIYPLFNSDSTAVLAWTYVSANDDSKRYFDAHGLLLSITARNGTAELLTYSTGESNDTSVSRYPATAPICAQVQDGSAVFAGLLLCVTDNWGRQLQFKYDSVGRIIEVIAPSNQSYYYEYDGPSGGCLIPDPANPACAANNLTKVTYPDGMSRTYFYNEASLINNGALCNISTPAVGNGFGQLLNLMTGKVDENGARFATWTYECEGKATSSQLAGGVQKAALSYVVYSTGDTDTTVTRSFGDPAAPQTRVQHYTGAQMRGLIKNTSISQPCEECGPIKTRIYDGNGNVTYAFDFNGVGTSYTYDLTRNLVLTRVENYTSSNNRKTTYSWHPTYRLPLKVAQAKRITTFTYDATGNLLTHMEQATNDAAGAAGFSATVVGAPRVWTYTYNSDGQVLTVTGPRTDIADVTTYAYDAVGNLSTITNALGQVITLSDYDGNGNVGRIVAPNGMVTTMLYTARGWLKNRTVSTLTATETTAYEYDGVGQLKKVTLPDLSIISYTYDDAHRLTGVIDSLGNSVSYTLDLTGNRVADQAKDPGGTLTRNITRVFDSLERLQKQTGGVQ